MLLLIEDVGWNSPFGGSGIKLERGCENVDTVCYASLLLSMLVLQSSFWAFICLPDASGQLVSAANEFLPFLALLHCWTADIWSL